MLRNGRPCIENPPLLAGPAERTSRTIYALSRAGHVQSRLVAVAWVPTAEKAEGGIPDQARGERASGWALHCTQRGWFGWFKRRSVTRLPERWWEWRSPICTDPAEPASARPHGRIRPRSRHHPHQLPR